MNSWCWLDIKLPTADAPLCILINGADSVPHNFCAPFGKRHEWIVCRKWHFTLEIRPLMSIFNSRTAPPSNFPRPFARRASQLVRSLYGTRKNLFQRHDLWNSKNRTPFIVRCFSPHQWLYFRVLKTNHALFMSRRSPLMKGLHRVSLSIQSHSQTVWHKIDGTSKPQNANYSPKREREKMCIRKTETIDKRLMWFVAIKACILL